jgi:hypothetical protein
MVFSFIVNILVTGGWLLVSGSKFKALRAFKVQCVKGSIIKVVDLLG